MNNPFELHQRLVSLIQQQPDLQGEHGPDFYRWAASATVAIGEALTDMDRIHFESALRYLKSWDSGESSHRTVQFLLHKAAATVEARLPAGARGAFVPVGEAFSALQAVGKVLGSAEHSVLIVDPYMDAVTVTDYLPLVRAGVSIRLLTDANKSALTESTANAVRRFTQQYGDSRPVSARAAAARSLHDRLILVDGRDVWSLTQSLKDFADRSPASLLQADSGTAALKLEAYERVWAAASAL